MSVTGAGTEQVPDGGGAEAPGGGQAAPAGGVPPDFVQRFDQFVTDFGGVGERLERVESALQTTERAPQEPRQPQTPDSRYLMDPETGLYFDRLTNQWHEEPPAGAGGSEYDLTPAQVQEMVQHGVEQAMQPYAQQNRRQQYAALEEAYPDLRDKEIVAEVAAEAQRLIAATPGADPEAWRSPELLETLYLARQARQGAEGEVRPEGQPSTVLEDPAAAAAGAKELEDEGDKIVQAGQAGRFFS